MFPVDTGDSTPGQPTAPTITSIVPSTGPIGGGTTVTISGSGFEADGVGIIVVRIGGIDATPPVVQDDGTLSVQTPAGSAGVHDVQIVTSNGPALLPEGFTYVVEASVLYGADGKDGVPGMLYEIDPSNGTATPIGSVGFAVNGLALSPSGDLFATEATDFGVLGNPRLLRVDPTTGAGSVIAPLLDSSRKFVHVEIPDISFVGGRLIGWSERGDVPVEINTTTGLVMILGPSLRSDGDGVVGTDGNTAYLTPERNDGGILHSIDVVTGLTTPTVDLAGTAIQDGRIIAMTMHAGTLYGVLRDNGGVAPPDTSTLVSIDPSTGAVAEIGLLPPEITSLSEGP
jgi:hypothetical protein